MKKITGTFLDEVTWDIPSQNWGKEEWRTEFDTMKETGIDTVIIIRAGLRDTCIFDSEVLGAKCEMDLAQLFLDESQRCGMKLYFGSYDPGNLSWEWDNWEESWPVCAKFIEEMQHRYGDHPAFHGWYIAPETCAATPGSIAVYKNTSQKMKEVAERPVLISPYYPSHAYRDCSKQERHKRFVDDWNTIFSEAKAIDIAAFQDGSCSFHQEEYATLELEDYIKEVHQVCTGNGIVMWNNVETFGRTFPIKFPPIDWRIMKKKMELAEPYTEKNVTFEFSHFMSPNSMWPSARNLYKRYMEEIIG